MSKFKVSKPGMGIKNSMLNTILSNQPEFIQIAARIGAKIIEGVTVGSKKSNNVIFITVRDPNTYHGFCSNLEQSPSYLVMNPERDWVLEGSALDGHLDSNGNPKQRAVYVCSNYPLMFEYLQNTYQAQDLQIIDAMNFAVYGKSSSFKISKISTYHVEYNEGYQEIIVECILNKRNFLKEINAKCVMIVDGVKYDQRGDLFSLVDFVLGSNKVEMSFDNPTLTVTMTNDEGTYTQTYTMRSGKLKKQSYKSLLDE